MNYCGKCGRKIDPETGLCPKCDKKKLVSSDNKKISRDELMRRFQTSQENDNTEQNQTNDAKINDTNEIESESPRKHRFHPLIVFISLTLCLTIIVGVVLSAFGIINLPFIGNNDRVKKISENMYVTTPNEKNVKFDEGSGIPYINNEVMITFTSGTSRTSVEDTIKSINGKIIGVIENTNTFQVEIKACDNFTQLTTIISEIEKSDIVEHAGPDLLILSEPDYYPRSDVHWENEWNTVPDGGNWGIEAIKAPAAWDYLHDMNDVNVGIMDGQFLDHEDLHFEKIVLNSNNRLEGYEHGTHVSGTIGAGFDNKIGISGVCPKSKLYGFSITGNGTAVKKVTSEGEKSITYLAMYELGLANLLSECKVVNISQNTGREICYAASQGDFLYGSLAQSYLVACANEIEKYLSSLVKSGKEFTLVVAAGNVNTIHYEKDESEDYQDYPNYGYKEVSKGGKSGGALAKYNNFLNTIETKEIKDRIIVVGAIKNDTVGNDEAFSYCDFSNIGDRVDVVAPGYEIESTVDNNGYESEDWSGTSMAVPHVSGIAAMLYSVNPELKGDEVKKIICETATRKVDGYKLVDAEAAVKRALNGSISGGVVSSNNNAALKDVSVTAYQTVDSEQKEIANTSTGEKGGFELNLPAGNYDLVFIKDEYKPHTLGIKIDKGVMTILKDDIVLEPDIRIDVNNCISDAVNESYSVDHYSATCRLPKFLIDTDEIAAVNSEILNKYNSYLQKNESAQQTNRYDFLYDIDYTYVIYDNILSLMIKNHYVPSNGYSEYSVYNIDISSASLLSRDEMMERFGVDWGLVKSSIRNQKNSSYGMKIDEANISDDNLNNTQFYIGEDKKLYAIYRWKSGPGIGGEDGYRYDVFKIDG